MPVDSARRGRRPETQTDDLAKQTQNPIASSSGDAPGIGTGLGIGTPPACFHFQRCALYIRPSTNLVCGSACRGTPSGLGVAGARINGMANIDDSVLCHVEGVPLIWGWGPSCCSTATKTGDGTEKFA